MILQKQWKISEQFVLRVLKEYSFSLHYIELLLISFFLLGINGRSYNNTRFHRVIDRFIIQGKIDE